MSTAGPSLSSGRHIQIDTGASEWPVNDTRRHSMVKEAPTILPDHTRDTKILQLFFFFLIYIYIFFLFFPLSARARTGRPHIPQTEVRSPYHWKKLTDRHDKRAKVVEW